MTFNAKHFHPLQNSTVIDFAHQTKYSLHNENLHISSAATDDSDLYTCEANNRLGTSKKDFRVNVQTPPKYVENINADAANRSNHNATEIIVRSGESVSLKCPFSGNPEPEISWTKLNEDAELSTESEILANIATLV